MEEHSDSINMYTRVLKSEPEAGCVAFSALAMVKYRLLLHLSNCSTELYVYIAGRDAHNERFTVIADSNLPAIEKSKMDHSIES